MPCVVWITSSRSLDHCRLRCADRRRRLELAPIVGRHGWLQERLGRHGVSLCSQTSPASTTQSSQLHIHGVALISWVKRIDSVLVPLDNEERLLMEYLGWTDSVSMLQVEEAVELRETVEFYHVGNSRFFDLPCDVASQLDGAVFEGDMRSFRQIMESWGCGGDKSYVLMAHSVFAALVCRRAWSVLPWSSTWKSTGLSASGLGLSTQTRRPQQLIQYAAASDVDPPQLRVSTLHSAADFVLELLALAKRSLGAQGAEDLDTNACIHVSALRSAAESLQVHSGAGMGAKKFYSAVVLVNTLFLVSVARAAGDLHRLLRYSVRLSFPSLSLEYETRSKSSIPSKATISAHRLRLDYALMKVHMHKFGSALDSMSSWRPGLEIPEGACFCRRLLMLPRIVVARCTYRRRCTSIFLECLRRRLPSENWLCWI